ncbi:hypothetical protein Zmor_019775 [Zophobas morio]|uniref:Gustatory receptor n=1 Tax=Zophobas morio TaxID=2755281 RepID=A0AA38I2J4_9CUCU|nr:hypothetical protein Zmor_019775 [Zophobas morio]
MTEKASMQDINFIRRYKVYLNIFMIVPWAAFDHKSVRKPILAKFYASVLIICKTLWLFCVLKYSDVDADLEKRLFSEQVVFSLTVTVLVVLVCSSIVKSAFFDNKNWILLFQNFYILDKHLKSVTEEKNIGRCYAKIFIKHLLFITLLGHGVWIFSTSAKFSFLKLFLFVPVIHLYYEFLTVSVLIILVEAFKSRYKLLSHKVLIFSNKNRLVQETKTIAQNYQILGETVQIFNGIFGYKIILIILHCALEVIRILNTCYAGFFVDKSNFISVHLLISNICLLFYIGYVIFAIILPIEATVQESKTFIDLCYKAKLNFSLDSEEVQALEKLASHAKHFGAKFTAAEFFDINKVIIFSFIGHVMTYFIIVMQLNVKVLKNRYKYLNKKLLISSTKPGFIQEAKNIAKDYQILNETVQLFNGIFGYKILFIILHSALTAVSTLNACYAVVFVYKRDSLLLHLFISNISYLCYLLYVMLAIILPIESTVRESKTFVDLCYKIKLNFSYDSQEFQVLEELVLHGKHFMVKFTAAGHFDIHKALIFNFVGNVVSYFIIVFQLNGSELLPKS